jgi:hypothetical protein
MAAFRIVPIGQSTQGQNRDRQRTHGHLYRDRDWTSGHLHVPRLRVPQDVQTHNPSAQESTVSGSVLRGFWRWAWILRPLVASLRQWE